MNVEKGYKGLPMEGPTATWYAKNTGRDRRRFTKMADAVARRIPTDCTVLEVAPGPGFLAVELARRGYRVTAVDISRSFVQIARDNAAAANVAVDVRLGNASALPFNDASFDLVICSAAFKNFSDPIGALNEMHRVLIRARQAFIFDLRKDAADRDIRAEVQDMQLSPINAWLTRQIFRFGLLRAAYAREQLAQMAAASRFGEGEILEDGIGFQLLLTKGL